MNQIVDSSSISHPPSVRKVPAFDVHEYRPKAADYCVCLFVINEDGKLHAQLEMTRPFLAAADVVIADGGSSDGSTSQDLLEPLGVNTLLVKTGPGRLGAQMR